MFFKKKKIKFYCELPEVKEKYPIIEAKKYNFEWFKKSAQHFKETVREKANYEQITGIARCPGVIPVMNEGFIFRSWFDLTIKPGDYQIRFEFFLPQGLMSYLKDKNYDKRLISWFSGEENSHKINVPAHQMKSLIKITLPWVVSIPKGWKLLFMPIPYPDTTDFESVHGILEEGDFYQINAIIKINSDKEFKIAAGTPLFQILPIEESKSNIEILDYNREIKQKEINSKYLANHQFVVK